MIRLTRLNQETFLLNSDLIEQVDITPDAVITLTSGHKLLVCESPDEIVRRVLQFRCSVFANTVSTEPKPDGALVR
jgi:flagellar protein FlbD